MKPSVRTASCVPAERKPLTDKVLTTQPASQADALEFKTAYEEAYAELAKLTQRPPSCPPPPRSAITPPGSMP